MRSLAPRNALGCQRRHGACSKKISSFHGFDLLRMTWKDELTVRLTLSPPFLAPSLLSFLREYIGEIFGRLAAGRLRLLRKAYKVDENEFCLSAGTNAC